MQVTGFGNPQENTEMVASGVCSQDSDSVRYTYEYHAGYATHFIKC